MCFRPLLSHGCVHPPARHDTGIARPWYVDRLPYHYSKTKVSAVAVCPGDALMDGYIAGEFHNRLEGRIALDLADTDKSVYTDL